MPICIYKLCIKEDYVHLLCAYVRVIASSECKHDGQWYLFFRCTFCCCFIFILFFLLSAVGILFSFLRGYIVPFLPFHLYLYRVRACPCRTQKNRNRRKNIMVNPVSHCARVTSDERGKRVTTLECILENPSWA